MSIRRLLLLSLLLAGTPLELGVLYFSWYPMGHVAKPLLVLHLVFLLAIPMVVWKISGERLLRGILICVWAAFFALWCIGAYRVLTD